MMIIYTESFFKKQIVKFTAEKNCFWNSVNIDNNNKNVNKNKTISYRIKNL